MNCVLGCRANNAVARFEQLGVAGKIVIVKRPVGMIIQFFIALVEAVSRGEERNRIGDMNGDRHAELPARVPHRIEARVVDLSPSLPDGDVLAQEKSQRLQNLQTARAARHEHLRIAWACSLRIAGLEKAL